MSKNFYCLFFAASIMFAACNSEKPDIYDLRCEYLVDPLGIDVETPRFSWKLSGYKTYKALTQRDYRIMIATSPEKLETGKADVWDSKTVASDQSHLIPFGGNSLKSGKEYFWQVKVSVTGSSGIVFEIRSKTARFVTGLFNRADWKGDWIRHPDATSEKHIWFRKNFTLDSQLSSAFVYLASMGNHELYVNGKKVDDRVMAPAISRLDRRALYVTYDIAELLQKGKNTVAVWYAAGWTRNDYFTHFTNQCFLLQMNGITAKNEDFELYSDRTWKCAESYSRNTGYYRFMDMGGEEVDGRNYTQKWNTVGFDDSNWKNAVGTQPLKNNGEPVLSAQMTDPTAVIETIPVESFSDTVPDVRRADMGKSFTGFLAASFKGLKTGDTVIIQISNRKDVIEEHRQIHYYIARGEDGETFSNRFNYFAGRYIAFSGLKNNAELLDVTGYAITSAAKRAGYFECSSEMLNSIHEMDRWTYEMCHTEGVVVDCPNRERLGYGMEGGYQTTWGLGLPCFLSAPYYIKNIRDWSDVQKDDGKMNYVAPHISDMWGNSMAGAASMNIAFELYSVYGDKRPLETARETGRRWLDFLFQYLDGDGLLTDYDGRHGYFLGEWLMPKHIQEFNTEDKAIFFNNCSFAMTLDLYIRISEILGKTGETATYREKLQTVRNSLHRKYYNPEVGSYLDGDQVRTAFALYVGIFPDELQSAALEHLENDLVGEHPYFNIGSFSRYPYWHVLLASPQFSDIICNILLKTEYPGYGYFFSKGETTFPETWEIDEDRNSANIHTGNTGISAWFIKSLAGIEPETSGYRTVSIKPHVVQKLDYAKAGVETPYGLVESSWRKEGAKTVYEFSIPAGCSDANISIAGTLEHLTANGRKISRAKGINKIQYRDGYILLNVASGKHRFETTVL
ncbi:MAG: glycoside hydrolase family 78 protein [Prevotellaceae bacterium]|jgi:alpha-L-rhamnosidase|nr:glycoside hydrolase family 78 protein [Prevotellaceae bacterium]